MTTDPKQIDGEGVDWIYLALDRNIWRAVVNPVMNVRVLLIFELLCEYLKNCYVGRTVLHAVRFLISWLTGWLVS
jgi:hypothetical protein